MMDKFVSNDKVLDVKEFSKLYRAEISTGKQYLSYNNQPMNYADYINSNPMNTPYPLTTKSETGVKLEMTTDDFERLMISAMEGEDHKRFRDRHPAARELYEQYRMMYELSRSY